MAVRGKYADGWGPIAIRDGLLKGRRVRNLAAASGVAWKTIGQFEKGRPLRNSTAAKIAAAFAADGVELVADDERIGTMLVYAKRAG